MGKEKENRDVIIQMSPDFMARMDEQIDTILTDITTESFRVARSRGMREGAAAVNCYPMLLQVIGIMIMKQHEALCKAAVLSSRIRKGPVS